MFEEEEKRVQQPAEDNESTSDTVEVAHFLVPFAEGRQGRVLAGEEEEGGELGDRDGGGAVEVGEVIKAVQEQAEDDDRFVGDAEGNLAEGELEEREWTEEDLVIECAEAARQKLSRACE